ncbi:hypothetical protein TSTA_007460 [Talaromyces stipitatus ATCC 10500]|uniref:AMP-dependent synthetase/ligase domain-containing protein n=1 Tax=Talaromyces stipitatus (strain ATCC 10500 / CBS 375.48 / QM 6759 / NRRL 1006) TaxID=441959 RepID=B8MVE7_TALSN|nr:uncharacterized protein TSTA_007460 [Talaromyces stipitatus ATCC 10500]EED11456.1 hypothetical protein TSTA_007460 [Talaromyces stipitatus ATCC 10500]
MENGTKDRPVGLVMDSNLTLVIYLFALIGLGVPTVLLSTRLSAEAVRHLVQKTRTSTILVPARLDGTAGEALSSWDTNDSPPPSKYYPAAYRNFLTEEASSSTAFSQNNVSRKPFCLPEVGTIFTGPSITQLLRSSGAKSLLTVPSILEEIALLPDNEEIHALQQLHFIAFGGRLPKETIGDKLTAAGEHLPE